MSDEFVLLDKCLSRLDHFLSELHSSPPSKRGEVCQSIFAAAKSAELIVFEMPDKQRQFAERLIGEKLREVWSICFDISSDYRPESQELPCETETLEHRKTVLGLGIEVKKVLSYSLMQATSKGFDIGGENQSRTKPIPTRDEAIRELKDAAAMHPHNKAKAKDRAATAFGGKRRWFEKKVIEPHRILDREWWQPN